MTIRTLVRMADGIGALVQAVADRVEHLLALGGELAHRPRPPLTRAPAIRRSRRERSSWRASSSSLAGVASSWPARMTSSATRRASASSPGGSVGGRGAQAAAQVLGGAAGHRGGEQLARGRRRRGAARPRRAARGSRTRNARSVCSRRSRTLWAPLGPRKPSSGPGSSWTTGASSHGAGPSSEPVAGARRRRSAAAAAAVSAAWAARRRRAGSAITLSTSVEGTLRRSETSWTSSLRSTLGGSGAIDSAARLSAASRASVPVRSPLERPLDLEVRRRGRRRRAARASRPRRRAGRRRPGPGRPAGARSGSPPGPVRRSALCSARPSRPRPIAFWPAASGSWQNSTRGARRASASTCCVGQRRPHRADRLGHARLAQRDHVRVALDEHHAAGLRRRRAREVGAVDQPPLVEDLAVGRVQVLGLLPRPQRPRAEAEHPAALVGTAGT